jgi:two-component system, sensor histidine kinase
VVSILVSHAIKTCLRDEITIAVSTFSIEREQRLILTVSVGDNGPDLPPERLRGLFDPPEVGGYNQANLELGLPLAFQLIRAMGGDLCAESISGSGTMFTITLPLRPQPESGMDTGAPTAAGSSALPYILLVEDNEVAQRFMTTVLERKGYRVRVAPSGPDAIHAVSEENFDLVLMDIQMPEMDGMEATRRIRALANGAGLPIVACTANTASEVRNACINAGMDDFLSKPVHTTELVAVVSKYLALKSRSE